MHAEINPFLPQLLVAMEFVTATEHLTFHVDYMSLGFPYLYCCGVRGRQLSWLLSFLE